MRLNNKGFAISSMMYSILLLFLMLVLGVFAMLGSRKVILDKVKGEVITELTQNKTYVFTFEHQNILLANTSKVSNFNFTLLDGVKIVDQNGNTVEEVTIDVNSEPAFDSTVNGTYKISYTATHQGYLIEAERIIEVVDPVTYEYAYTGGEQQFNVPASGVYRAELWGAQGGSITGSAYNSDGSVRANSLTYTGGKGAYTVGNVNLEMGTNLYLYVGGTAQQMNHSLLWEENSGTTVGGYNGGGSLTDGQHVYGAPGGGATDIRLVNGNWDNFDSLKSRIMVASGGGGANFRNQGYGEGNGGEGGTLNGITGYEALTSGSYWRSDYNEGYAVGTGGTQTSGGYPIRHYLNGTVQNEAVDGTFGGANVAKSQSGSGGGYYSGGSSAHGGAGGGSSFISGYLGCNAILESSVENNIVHSNQPVHYSGYSFVNSDMKAGNETMPTYDGNSTMIGNTGNGHAKITALITILTQNIDESSVE